MRQRPDHVRSAFSVAVLLESRKAPEEVSDNGAKVKQLSAKVFVIGAALIAGAVSAMIVVIVDRGAQKRKRDSENLSALLGTVYQHQHKNF